MLAEQAPENLQVVLVGTTLLEVTLSRHRLTHPASFVGVDTLSFTAPEVKLLRTARRSRARCRDDLRGVQRVADRRAAHDDRRCPTDARAQSASSFLGTYVREHVLGALPAEIADFVLDGSVCGELTPELAAAA